MTHIVAASDLARGERVQQVACRSREPVEPRHHQHVASVQLVGKSALPGQAPHDTAGRFTDAVSPFVGPAPMIVATDGPALRVLRQMKSAWIITQEGTRHPTEVIGILSARNSAKSVKAYVEWFYALLHYAPGEHLAFAKYTRPHKPYKAQYWTTNTGVPVHSLMICGHNPYLVARLGKNISLIEGDEGALRWTEPDRIELHETPQLVIEKIPGCTLVAPIHLPLEVTTKGYCD